MSLEMHSTGKYKILDFSNVNLTLVTPSESHRKTEVYSFLWSDEIDFDKYYVMASNFGGPIGIKTSNINFKHRFCAAF